MWKCTRCGKEYEVITGKFFTEGCPKCGCSVMWEIDEKTGIWKTTRLMEGREIWLSASGLSCPEGVRRI